MASDVTVKLTLSKPVGRLGFGLPLLLDYGAEADISYTLCSELEDVTKAGFDKESCTYKTAQLIFMQEDPPTIAVEATTLDASDWLGFNKNTYRPWRQILFTKNNMNTTEELKELIPIVEALDGKIGFFSVEPETELTEVTTEGIERSFVFFNSAPKSGGLPVAALVGATATYDPGSFTYKNIIVKGLTPESDDIIQDVHEKGGVTFVTKAGDNVTSEGKVLGGEYLDIIDSKDYILQQIEYRTQKLLNRLKKVAYTDGGIVQLENVCETVLREVWRDGKDDAMISTKTDGSPDYSVNYALREETDENDRVVRKYILGRFSFALAGAIHEVVTKGEITF